MSMRPNAAGYDFARRLRRVVAITGLSQADFADLCGLSRQTVSTYLSGRAEPRWSTLRKIMRATGCTARDLLGGAE